MITSTSACSGSTGAEEAVSFVLTGLPAPVVPSVTTAGIASSDTTVPASGGIGTTPSVVGSGSLGFMVISEDDDILGDNVEEDGDSGSSTLFGDGFTANRPSSLSAPDSIMVRAASRDACQFGSSGSRRHRRSRERDLMQPPLDRVGSPAFPLTRLRRRRMNHTGYPSILFDHCSTSISASSNTNNTGSSSGTNLPVSQPSSMLSAKFSLLQYLRNAGSRAAAVSRGPDSEPDHGQLGIGLTTCLGSSCSTSSQLMPDNHHIGGIGISDSSNSSSGTIVRGDSDVAAVDNAGLVLHTPSYIDVGPRSWNRPMSTFVSSLSSNSPCADASVPLTSSTHASRRIGQIPSLSELINPPPAPPPSLACTSRARSRGLTRASALSAILSNLRQSPSPLGQIGSASRPISLDDSVQIIRTELPPAPSPSVPSAVTRSSIRLAPLPVAPSSRVLRSSTRQRLTTPGISPVLSPSSIAQVTSSSASSSLSPSLLLRLTSALSRRPRSSLSSGSRASSSIGSRGLATRHSEHTITAAAAAQEVRRALTAARSEADSPDAEDCVICLSEKSNRAVVLPCMHTFCFDCIHRWFSINPLCPLCKRLGHRLLHSIRSDAQYAELLVADIAPAAGLLGPPDGISSSAFGPSGPASAAFTGQPHTHHHYHHLHHHHFHYRRPSLVFGHEFDGPGPAADSGPPASFSPAGLTPMPTSTHSRRQTSGSTSAQLRPFLLSTTAVNITSITTTATTSLSSPSGIEVSSPSRFLTSSSSLIDFLSSRMPSSIPYVPSSESLLTPSSFASFSPPATNAAASCATTSLSLQQQQNVISSTSITSPCLAIPLAADLSHSLIRMQTDILSSNRSTTDTSSRTAQQLVRPLTDAHPPPLGSWLSASPYFPSVSSESRDSTLWSTSVRRRFATTSRIPSSLSWQLVADAILPSEPWSMDGLLLRQLVYIYPLHSYVM